MASFPLLAETPDFVANVQQIEKTAARPKAASTAKSVRTPALPALLGWLDSQRNLSTHPTAHELARSIKRNLFAE